MNGIFFGKSEGAIRDTFYIKKDKWPESKRVKYGKNKIVVTSKISVWKRLAEPLKDPLLLMLLGAAIVSFFVDEVETGIVFFVIPVRPSQTVSFTMLACPIL